MGFSTVALVCLLAITGVHCDDKELGEECSSSDNCVHPSIQLACSIKDGDTVKTCLIKNGESCAGLTDSCVAGAACMTNSCACKASIYTAASGLCTVAEDKWAGACPASGTCAGTGLECNSGLSMCLCATDKAVALATGLCTTSIAAEKVGKSCTTATATTACGSSTNLECVNSKCTCAAGYTGPVGGTCTQITTNGKVGKACTTSNQNTNCGAASTSFMECTNSHCACMTDYYGIAGGVCYPAKGKLNGGCSGTNQGTCSAATLECTGTGAKSCKSIAGGTCTTDADCESTTTYVCDPFASQCLIKVGQTCTNNPDKCRSGAKCTGSSSTVCECDTTISTDSSGVCNGKNGYLGASCSATVGAANACTAANTECNTNGNTCSCLANFNAVPSTLSCSKAGTITASVLVMLVVGIITQMVVIQ